MLALLVLAATVGAQPIPQDATAPKVAQILRDLDARRYQVQRRAVLAARKTKDPKLLDKLLHLARHARHPNIRGYSCETLGHYRDPRIFPLLEKAATTGPLSTRTGALPGLGLLRDPRSYDLLVKALEDRNNWSYAATGLQSLGDKRGAGPLAGLFRKHVHDHFVYGHVIEAIFALHRDAAVDLFFDAIQNPRVYQHHRLERLLGQVKTEAVRDRAGKLLTHDSIKVRTTGVRILGVAGSVRSVAVLMKVMDSQEDLRSHAIRALGQLGHELAVPQIVRYLQDEDEGQRSTVATALGKIGHPTALRPLVRALRAEEETIPKLRMIEALGRIGNRRAVAELGRHLADKTVEQQPMTVSSIWSFPYNVPVNWAAWWSLRCIADGKEPQPVRELFTFHGRGQKVKESAIETMSEWWKEHRGKTGFSLK